MAWVKWEKVCQPKHLGGLGVKDLEVFNLSLIAKWKWRLITEDESQLWKKILISRYGDARQWSGELPAVAIVKKTSLWWRDLVLLGEGLLSGRNWFNSVTKMKLGDGSRVKFWTDKWIGSESLAELFPSVFQACESKDCTVSEMGEWKQSGWAWNLLDRSLPAAVADASRELNELLLGVQLQKFSVDRYVWLADTIRGFTVKSCYEWVCNSLRGGTSLHVNPIVEACNSLWKSDIPSKVLIFCWRLLLNKLPTRVNLHNRGVLSSLYEVSCVFCFRELESADHLFCNCTVVRAVWRGVFSWMNLNGVLEENIIPSFHQVSSGVRGKNGARIKHLFWAATMWQLWIARNRTLFEGVVVNVNSVIYSIKFVSWSWFVSRKGRNSGVSFSDWCSCPMGCISSM